jgi:hypothetical protein
VKKINKGSQARDRKISRWIERRKGEFEPK